MMRVAEARLLAQGRAKVSGSLVDFHDQWGRTGRGDVTVTWAGESQGRGVHRRWEETGRFSVGHTRTVHHLEVVDSPSEVSYA